MNRLQTHAGPMDLEQLTGIPVEIDFRTLGIEPAQAVPEMGGEGFFEGMDGYSTICIPPDLFDADVRHLAVRIVGAVHRMEPATNPLMRAVYRMLSRLADQKVIASPAAVAVGLLLGAAKVHGVKIQTHPRHLAKEVGCRYAVMLAIRRAAVEELQLTGISGWALEGE